MFNEEELKQSSTAGGFQIIAKHIIKSGGKVVGCAWNDKWQAEHIIVDSLEGLKKLYKSKYVQSFISDSIKKAYLRME